MHLNVEHLIVAPAPLLGLVHGRVCVAEDLFGVFIADVREHEPHAHGGEYLPSFDLEGLRQNFFEPFGCPQRTLMGIDALQ